MEKFNGTTDPGISQREIDNMAHSRKLAGECMVLLENDGVLPIKEGGKVALFGNGVRRTVKGGTGSGDVNSRNNVNVEQGFLQAGFEITTGPWLDRQEANMIRAREDYFKWVAEEVEKGAVEFLVTFEHPYKDPAPVAITEEDCRNADTDTAFYVITRNSGEAADRMAVRGDYFLLPEEKAAITMMASHFRKAIVLLNIGGIMDMTELKEIEGLNAILLMTQLGNITGNVLTDVVTGKVTPSGKLTDTWAKKYEDYPSSATFSFNNGNVDDDWYTDGIYVGYRYFDTFHVDPVYHFGYGKSYTDFEILPQEVKVCKETVSVSAKVTNTGDTYAGKEVVQVYVSCPDGKLDKPYQVLTGYAKTKNLAPGESQEVKIDFSVRSMTSYSEEEAAWILEPGQYIVRVGNSSADTLVAAVLVLDQEVRTEICRNILTPSDTIDLIRPEKCPGSSETAGLPAGVPCIAIDAAGIETVVNKYQGVRQEYTTDKTDILTVADIKAGKCTVEELTAQLTVEEMADLCVGSLRAAEGSIVGNASQKVPGAAGDTSAALLESRGIRGLILADGPAGLRLQPHYKVSLDGQMIPGGSVIGDSIEPFAEGYDETNSIDYYQYCTAIPIGWALAQSWNDELVEETGRMVGSEMEIFNCDLWLAPALNIHRNPLCGRNFEYYSEDPVISGCMAAAMTRGVQSWEGRGTTIKHFTANNQEEHRYFTNVHVTERTMREIYLKGFEICVRNSQPLSIMTSYNLVNGVHTANCYDTIQSALRDEWGFENFVMTDWFTSQDIGILTGKYPAHYPIAASTGCIYAGNDNQQPGCRQNLDDIIRAVNTGETIDGFPITKADLQFNAANIIRTIVKCAR